MFDILNFYSNKKNKKKVKFEIGIYKYIESTIKDVRIVKKLKATTFEESFRKSFDRLLESQEIAIQSRVTIGEDIYHMPLIDFANNVTLSSLKRSDLTNLLKDFKISESLLFSSGRSFHLYGKGLLTHEEWLIFMGRLLLLANNKGESIVDYRWVGHRLIAGYGALRWTKNTRNYLEYPKLVARIRNSSIEKLK